METYKIQIIETIIAVISFFAVKIILMYFVKLTIKNSYFKNAEQNDVLKVIRLILMVVLCIIIVAIWSVKQENILIFASSLLTVFGVALFAEMSILTNITACLILFFQHPIKVGDTIAITFEGKETEGELIDITYFFIFIKTPNRGVLTIPNALLLKSSFLVVEKSIKNEVNK
ncbi:mechanosensitive ion channel domain-containing protein [Flavobacterium sp. FZUC8N2.13]|uniref:Mechanosensitive ion channel n=4 Tax=Flavobacterium TaxID=237 RepID=A0A4R5CZX3_9FLAO|nr:MULTISPECIES: mechanosensitive ion channel domain-containing protein [Flavobacterium]PIF62630.1 mechanosensitive ion channel-like protein [Flavobacterium sp. 11]RBN49015.1 mechanosensitive ion channel protein MscS [Flavobacterium psychrolimnae]TDD77220.1 mechanosensitive ion channel [Flavobacterium caseinilyticum]TDE04234.1 mechanosensitive ion channel [Flavobacterium sandaracinum]